LITKFDLDDTKIDDLGYVITVNTAIPCLLAAFCFYKSAQPYAEQKISMSREKLCAIEAASSCGISQKNSLQMKQIISFRLKNG
jgi:hypothetical protein